MHPDFAKWQLSLEDPFRSRLLPVTQNFPERVAACAQGVDDEPAFDPELINQNAAKILLQPDIIFPHTMLERAVRIGLAHINATFIGDHPKYGKGIYSESCHDSFPPVIISAVDALTVWGLVSRAEELFGYWLNTFVRQDGTIDYRGTSLSEMGMLLTTGYRLMSRGGRAEWLNNNSSKLRLMANHLGELVRAANKKELIYGVPEDDERNRPARYFHNNAWIIRGFEDWAVLLKDFLGEPINAAHVLSETAWLKPLLITVIRETWPKSPSDWWLRPAIEEVCNDPVEWSHSIVSTRFGSYANYRYWPELISSNVLPRDLMMRIVSARLYGGGQFCGTTRFEDHLDDWPMAEWLEGLWSLGLYEDFHLCLWGHIFYHQARVHLTAYEQVTLPPGRQHKEAAYCLPCQLAAVRGARHLVK